jgi:peroxiredoxin (alkyl hydroperoxide reductase subunit C)
MQISVCSEAPNFEAAAVMPDGSIKEDFKLSDYKGKYILLFFYPLDFTFVCPSEIIAHHNRNESFKNKDTQIIGVSIDSQFSHYAWRKTPIENGGIGPISFPLVADTTRKIVESYGIANSDGVALRASFLIDRSGIIQHSTVNNLPLGRNVDEALRLIDALQFSEEHGEVCPAGWQKGDTGMKATQEGVSEYLSNNSSKL